MKKAFPIRWPLLGIPTPFCDGVITYLPSGVNRMRLNLPLETCPIADYIPSMKPAALRAEIRSSQALAVLPRNHPLSILRFTFYVLRFPAP